MAHFAEISDNNKVLRVVVVPDSQEHRGAEYLSQDLALGGFWLKTSYNTMGGIHYDPETGEPSDDQSKSLRKNFAGKGYDYDPELDAFIPLKVFDSWVFNEETCRWDPPVPYPDDPNNAYYWDEDQVNWIQTEEAL